MKVAIVTAHPDDAEISAGGLICAYRAMGADVTILCATDGAKGGPGDASALAAKRAKEAQAGAAILGAGLVMLGYPDGELPCDTRLARDLADRIAALAPNIVLSHPPVDYHADHCAVGQAAALAVSFRAPLVWLEPMLGVGSLPTHYIDITDHQPTKERAILCHASQSPARFVDQIRIHGRFRAAQCGHPGYAEALRHDPVYPFADVRGLLPAAPSVRGVVDRAMPLDKSARQETK